MKNVMTKAFSNISKCIAFVRTIVYNISAEVNYKIERSF